MQSIYAMHLNGSESIENHEKLLLKSADNILDLYLVMLSSLIEIAKRESLFIEKSAQKHTATSQEKNPNKKFINNSIINLLSNNNSLNTMLIERNINHWDLNYDYIKILTDTIKDSDLYKKYMSNEINNFEEDKRFIIDIFTEIIVPNDKFYEFLEDNNLTWIDDIPVVNTHIVKQLNLIKSNKNNSFSVSKIFKDQEDKEYLTNLFVKTVLNEVEFAKDFVDKTPNWDSERIAELDAIIIKMAICEFLKFPSIPVKVTINEYLEIAKEYSTPKSSIFINGILDNLVKEYSTKNKLNKIGRGLI
ncbi:MAG: transcription antitermination protein NusB [Flavobacteriaceae bacterium]|nr:transcription antitermination protein NusB [Flavobacteriaceae bacterium]